MSKVTSPKDKLYRQILGKISKKKGRSNEDKSIQYVLDNPMEYSCPDLSHTRKVPRGVRHVTDFFYTTYTDNNGNEQKAGFDIIIIPDDDGMGEYPVVLIQVKSTKLPDALYIKALQNFKVPNCVRKELHIWVDDELQILPL